MKQNARRNLKRMKRIRSRLLKRDYFRRKAERQRVGQ